MNIKIISIGQFKNSHFRQIFSNYISKLPWKLYLQELKASIHKNVLMKRKIDSKNLLAKTNPSEIIVSLDKSGEILSSEKVSKYIINWNLKNKDIAFLIGGPEGMTNQCLEKSHTIISFGKMTWPHLLVRVMLAEQLYRASTIISNHPYHRN